MARTPKRMREFPRRNTWRMRRKIRWMHHHDHVESCPMCGTELTPDRDHYHNV